MAGGKESLNMALQGLLKKITEINQNVFSKITVGSTTITADGKEGAFTLVAGTNVTLTPDAINDKITITAKDTTYSSFVKSGSGAAAGLVPAPPTTAGATKYLREDGTWAVPPDTNTTYTLPSFGITATAAQINAASIDSGWVACTLSGGVSAVAAAGVRRIGNVVFLRGRLTFTPSGAKDAGHIIATIPSGYRPTIRFYHSIQAQAARVAKMYVDTSGQIGIDHILNVETGGVVSTSAWVGLGHICWTIN